MEDGMFGLSGATIKTLHLLLHDFPEIDEVVLYGSRAMGRHHVGSDIDLTLKGDQIPLSLLHRLTQAVDDLLLPYTFDISIYNHISNESLKDHIQRVGVVFYRR